jgi:hypothetical protein
MKPITYPMRPMNGGNLDKPNAIIPPWARHYEPKANEWRMSVHVPTGSCFNRHNEPLTISDEFKVALEELRRQNEHEWLDCGGLSRRHGIGKGSIIVLDVPDLHKLTYVERRCTMLTTWQLIPDISRVKPNEIYVLPAYGHAKMRTVWEMLKEANAVAGMTGDNSFWEGLVGKRDTSTYEIQLRSDKHETTNWLKHRFV